MSQWIQVPLMGGTFEPESEYSMRPDPNEGGAVAPEVRVMDGWEPFCRAKRPGDRPETNKRPEWTFNPNLACQKVFTTWGTNDSGVYQRFDVPVGSKLKLEVDAMYSDNGSGVALRVGIDPFGGGIPGASAVQWSRWHGSTPAGDDPGSWPNQSEMRTITLEGVTSVQQAVTVFLRHANVHPGKDASAFWLEARLYVWSDDEPPPDPEGGDIVAELKAINQTLREIRDRI